MLRSPRLTILMLATCGLAACGEQRGKSLRSGWSSTDKMGGSLEQASLQTEPGEVLTLIEKIPSDLSIPRRLTIEQIRNGLKDLFSVDISDLAESFPTETSLTGFRGGVDGQEPNQALIAWFNSSASAVATRLLKAEVVQKQISTCGAQDYSCAAGFIEWLGERLLRRPLTEPEKQSFAGVADAAQKASVPFLKGMEWVVETMFQSPAFLYRLEGHSDKAVSAHVYQLSDYSLATRLAAMLWQSFPDDALREAARAGKLSAASTREAEIERLLKDPKAKRGVREFAEQWLSLHLLATIQHDEKDAPGFSPELMMTMRDATFASAEDIFLGEKDMLGFLTGTSAFVNKDLAKIYDPKGSEAVFKNLTAGLTKVELPASLGRSGYLLQPTFLSVSSALEHTDPVRRGLFVSLQFLCNEVPPPPPDVPTFPPIEAGKPKRERYEQHRSEPSCASCHRYMDQMGMAFEGYDLIGRVRDKDESGTKIDASGSLALSSDQQIPFDGPAKLIEILGQQNKVEQCFMEKMLSYAMGMRFTKENNIWQEDMAKQYKSGSRSYPVLIKSLVHSPIFRYVKTDEKVPNP